jgi:hypothetical protein
LTPNETIILKSIVKGLQESGIDPIKILGPQTKELCGDNKIGFRNLTDKQVIEIQELIMKDLEE